MASLIRIASSPTCQTGECPAPPKMAVLDDDDELVTVHCNRHAVGALDGYIRQESQPELTLLKKAEQPAQEKNED